MAVIKWNIKTDKLASSECRIYVTLVTNIACSNCSKNNPMKEIWHKARKAF